uniref:Uncharacterized protein n=1 Tax=Cruciviridae sp. TaxID=1955495 RepID=A0A1S6LVF8_9VIRU|nr:hypothetical protein [Cruciviridae sp.]
MVFLGWQWGSSQSAIGDPTITVANGTLESQISTGFGAGAASDCINLVITVPKGDQLEIDVASNATWTNSPNTLDVYVSSLNYVLIP